MRAFDFGPGIAVVTLGPEGSLVKYFPILADVVAIPRCFAERMKEDAGIPLKTEEQRRTTCILCPLKYPEGGANKVRNWTGCCRRRQKPEVWRGMVISWIDCFWEVD